MPPCFFDADGIHGIREGLGRETATLVFSKLAQMRDLSPSLIAM